MRTTLTALFVFLLTCPTSPADAQTLSVEIDAEFELEAPLEHAETQLGAPAVVVVRPLEDEDLDDQRPMYDRGAQAYEHVGSVAVAHASPAERAQGEDADTEGSVGLRWLVEGIDFGGPELTLSSPEIQAVRGATVPTSAIGTATIGGAGIELGMRAADYLRGPELHIDVAGGELGEDWHPVEGVDGFEMRPSSLFMIRAELAVGLQVPLGPVTPYLLARGAVGLAVMKVEVRHRDLGDLGNEETEFGFAQLGLEAGLSIEFGDGSTLDLAYRGSFLGAVSHGAILGVGFHGE